MVFRSSRKPPGYVEWREADHAGGDQESAYAYGATMSETPEPLTASLASAVNFLAGAWLLLAPFILGFEMAGGVIDGYWNEVVVGIVVALLALVRAFAPAEAPWFSIVNGVLGLWLIVSPFVLGYSGPDAAAATVVDVSAGVVIALLATTSAVSTYRSRRSSGRE